MHEHESRRARAAAQVFIALLTSFVIVTIVSPLLRWILSPNPDALIALSVLAAFPCAALLALARRQVYRVAGHRTERSSEERPSV
jgi:hypothetical protein